MFILGLGGSGHDFSACICDEHNVLGYVEDERITRLKNSFLLHNRSKISEMNSVFYLCDKLQIDIKDIKHVVINNILEKIFYSNFFSDHDIISINHHLAHACSAFYPSGFDEAAILVVDGAGDKLDDGTSETISFWYGDRSGLQNLLTFSGKQISENIYNDTIMPFENSIGGFYRAVTNLLGFGLFDEGKVMGLASYGNDRFCKSMRNLVSLEENGAFVVTCKGYENLVLMSEDLSSFQDKADFAFAAQTITNDAVLNAAVALKNVTGCKHICISGGVALNSVANYKIYKKNIYEDFFIQPASGDAGTAIGAALYGMHSARVRH